MFPEMLLLMRIKQSSKPLTTYKWKYLRAIIHTKEWLKKILISHMDGEEHKELMDGF